MNCESFFSKVETFYQNFQYNLKDVKYKFLISVHSQLLPQNSMTLTMLTYLLYLSISIGLTIFAGWMLYKNGRAFLLEIFAGRESLADSVNRLLLTGFSLINIGYISLTMNIGMAIRSPEHMLEKLSYKIGIILIVLAVMHFGNLLVLYRMRRSNRPHSHKGSLAKA